MSEFCWNRISALVSKNTEQDRLARAAQSPQPALIYFKFIFPPSALAKICQACFDSTSERIWCLLPCVVGPPGYEILLRQTWCYVILRN